MINGGAPDPVAVGPALLVVLARNVNDEVYETGGNQLRRAVLRIRGLADHLRFDAKIPQRLCGAGGRENRQSQFVANDQRFVRESELLGWSARETAARPLTGRGKRSTAC